MTKFTREELKEIEKHFDMAAGRVHEQIKLVTQLDKYGLEESAQSVLEDVISGYNVFRTISAKANELQKEVEDEDGKKKYSNKQSREAELTTRLNNDSKNSQR